MPISTRRDERPETLDPSAVAERAAVETLLNCYARELAPGALRDRPPVHDPVLRARWDAAGRACWWRLPMPASGLDVLVPLAHASPTGRHGVALPAFARRREPAGGPLEEIGALALFDLVLAEYRARAPLSDDTAARLRARFAESRDNIAAIVASGRPAAGGAIDRFLPAEQALWLGHPFHPIAKSRWGFSAEDRDRCSPELGGEFQLWFYLADPAIVIEDRATGGGGVAGDALDAIDALGALRAELLGDPATPPEVRALLARLPAWRVVPVHPWEARHLERDPQVAAAVARGLLIPLGPGGAPFAPTSSVRTVYRRDLPFQLKLSLHVAITNNQRVNQLHELRKGVAVTRLLASPVGARIREAMPWLRILRDPAYVAVQVDGELIEGFSTTIRDNPFHGDERVAVVAALCEPGLGGPGPLRRLVEEAAGPGASAAALAAAAVAWFDRYLGLLLDAAVPAHDRHGLSLEVHLQNLGVELGADATPVGLFFRDNQGFFVRLERAPEALRHAPGLADAGPCVLPEALVDDPIRYYLLVNNVLGVIQALGADGLCGEDALVRALDRRLRDAAAADGSGLVRDVISARAWPAKGNLRMILEDQDELLRPVETPAPYVGVPNPILPLRHLARGAVELAPGGVYRRAFDGYGGPFELRALDLERDLPMLHDWFAQPYAREFWQQHVPLAELEEWYAELLASPYHGALLGSFAGDPRFVVETYWAPRDVVGEHYPVRPGDHGFHILVAPPRTRMPQFTRRCFQVATEMLFACPEVERVIAEPDHRNEAALRVFSAVGFCSLGKIDLPDKRAALLVCTRESLRAACPDAKAPPLPRPPAPQRAAAVASTGGEA
jgi:siderophore synthetase component/RimJ/RimL family protein N-acetyltransferase